NGLTNGRGLVNGAGLINGNGLTNGRGLVNGAGLINGNGLVNGNGFVNGAGLIYSEGLINGFGPKYRYEDILKKHSAWHYRAVVAFLVIALLLPGSMLFVYNSTDMTMVRVDGDFAEWAEAYSFLETASDSPFGDLETRFIHRDDSLFLYLRTANRMDDGRHNGQILIFLDEDGNSSSGYNIRGMGADSVLQITIGEEKTEFWLKSGFNNSGSQIDWLGFEHSQRGKAFISGDLLEAEIPKEGMEKHGPAKVLIMTEDGRGVRSYTSLLTPEAQNILSYSQESGTNTAQSSVFLAPNQIFQAVQAVFYAPGETIHISRITCELVGSASHFSFNNAHLILDQGNGVIDMEDAVLSQSPVEANTFQFILEPPRAFPRGTLERMFISLELSATPERAKTASAKIIDIEGSYEHVDSRHVALPLPYIIEAPDRIELDGGFEDWHAGVVKNDPLNDVPDGNPNVDIRGYGVAIDQRGLFLYMDVAGYLMDGREIPRIIPISRPTPTPPPAPSPDPDDGDEPDEPYDGPPTKATTHTWTGEDVIRYFIDMDSNPQTGYKDPALEGGMEMMIEIRGRDGRITGSGVYSYAGTDNEWDWHPISTPEHFLTMTAIETFANITPATLLNSTVTAVIIAWNGTRDMGDQSIPMPQPARLIRGMSRGQVTKNLYLRTGNQLSTFVGGALATTQISAGSSATWTQAPAMAGDFNMTGTVSAVLHITPENAGGNRPSVTVSVGYGAVTLGSAAISNLASTGWYTFNIPATAIIPAGNAIWARISVSGANQNVRATISHNSQTYNSRIDIPTDTYINVEWVRTYNEG
ncbi:MAG: hypothetical protein QCI38_06905, partial [Candidatus Thermoplasmatota archaeon]|nr:hypothetical protein [Candidatus Thermoplasmatota archaeon]